MLEPGSQRGSSPSAQAACWTGPIDAATTWSVADSPCIVDQSVWVLEGVTLTIQPGVVVKVNPGLGLRIDGTLIARGTAEAPIMFTSSQAAPSSGDWAAIHFTDSAIGASFDTAGVYTGGSIFEYCAVEYGGGGTAQGAISAQSPRAPVVYKSIIRHNVASGI